MDDCNIIIRPLITEKTTHFASTRNVYAFEVNKKANKAQIKGAIERTYGVKVVSVRTANRKGKHRRRGRIVGVTPAWKKAVVFLEPEHRIDLF